jgi:hypothetical protein
MCAFFPFASAHRGLPLTGIAVPKRKLVHPKGAIPNSGFCIPYSAMGAKPYHYWEKKSHIA